MSEMSNVQMELVPRSDDSFPRDTTSPALVAIPKSGILITNHQNLLYMLASGLIMPPSGFGRKYYRDTLAAFSGWLPIFLDHSHKLVRAPESAIDDSTAESDHLRPVILEVELAGLRGPVQAHGEVGWAERQLEEGVLRSESVILLPAPLPTSRVRRIIFRSLDDRRETETRAASSSNATLKGIKKQTHAKRFSATTHVTWPLPEGPYEREVALPAAQAAGGMMAALHQLGSRGQISVQTCRAAFDSSVTPPRDSIHASLSDWMLNGRANRGDGQFRTGRQLFWGAVDRLVDHYGQSDGRRAEDILIAFYRESTDRIRGAPQVRRRAAALVSTLESLGGGFGGSSISEMLGHHQTPLGRAAILFLLRERVSELLELLDECPQLEETDRLAAGILFGVRDGWLRVPRSLRVPAGLSEAVTHRMAALAHRIDGSGIDLGRAPPRVKPLRELFGNLDGWRSREEKAAAHISRQLKWKCLTTRVRLGIGPYSLNIGRGAAYIDFEGEPKIESRVDRDRFLDFLSRNPIGSRIEDEVRKQLDA